MSVSNIVYTPRCVDVHQKAARQRCELCLAMICSDRSPGRVEEGEHWCKGSYSLVGSRISQGKSASTIRCRVLIITSGQRIWTNRGGGFFRGHNHIM